MALVLFINFVYSNQNASNIMFKQNHLLENNETKCIYDSIYSQNVITNNNICFIRCTFKSLISSSVGGAIAVSLRNSFGQNNLIDDCKFLNCRSNFGGAIYFNIQKNSFTQIMNTIFENNSANSPIMNSGGAIYFTSTIECDFEIKNCIFYSNVAYLSKANSSSLSNDGGALFISTEMKCYFKVDSCLFDNNAVYSLSSFYNIIGKGGSIFINSQNKDDFQVCNCSFKSNSAQNYGGCIYLSNVQYSIEKCSFLNNYINKTNNYPKGAAIYVNNSNGTLFKNSFINNSINSKVGSYGGAVSFIISKGLFNECNFTNNIVYSHSTYSYGGAILIYLPNTGRSLVSMISMSKFRFTNNSAYSNSNAYGGAISFLNTFSSVRYSRSVLDYSLDECFFINNSVYSKDDEVYGGSISFALKTDSSIPQRQKFGFSSNEYLNKCVFENNFAYSINSNAYGGAISNFYYTKSTECVLSTNTTLEKCVFINNTVYSQSCKTFGGAFYFFRSSLRTGDILIGLFKSCTFANNTVYSISNSSYGGALSITRLVSGNIENCTFINNLAKTFLSTYLYQGDEPRSLGGAIYLISTDIYHISCNFINNTGFGDAPKHISTGKGGAICAIGSIVEVSNCSFINNTLCNYGLTFDIDCYINGGACYFSNSNIEVFECNFSDNKVLIHAYEQSSYFSARTYGGAIYSNNQKGTINCVDCIFEKNYISVRNNKQKEFAGAISLMKGKIKNCIFNDNIAYYGGDIRYDQTENSYLYVENCSFNHFLVIEDEIKSLIHIRIKNNTKSTNSFIHNKVIINISTTLFDGKIDAKLVTNKVLLLKFSFKSNCITPFNDRYFKTQNLLIYNKDGIEYQNISSAFQSDCDDFNDTITESIIVPTEIIFTQTDLVATQTEQIETQTDLVITQTEQIETQTDLFITQTETVQTQTDISETNSANTQEFSTFTQTDQIKTLTSSFTSHEEPITYIYTERTQSDPMQNENNDSKSNKKIKLILIICSSIIVIQAIIICGLIIFLVIKRRNKNDLIHAPLMDESNLSSMF